MEISIYDTLSGTKKVFNSAKKRNLNLYVCGITPYSLSHIGHGRSYVTFDLLVRVAKFFGFEVKYVRNFTDIDDKLLAKAKEQFGDEMRYPEVAKAVIEDFWLQLSRLNCVSPSEEPLATKSINDMASIIKVLLDKDIAYQSGNDIFFDVTKFDEYGKLSKKKLEDLVAGARIAVNESKRNPFDFVLWKGNSEERFWKRSGLPFGRPGWHIECSAMIKKSFAGETIDIHGGGADLVFPHHENEIAQSEAAFLRPLANCWMHNGLLNINHEKMSKSLSNDLSMNVFFQKIEPMVFRFYLLQHHFASPIDFSEEKLIDAKKSFYRLVDLAKSINLSDLSAPTKEQVQFVFDKPFMKDFLLALSDNLNSAKGIGILFKHFDEISLLDQVSLALVVYTIENVLGLALVGYEKKSEASTQAVEFPEEIKDLLQKREQARQAKDWQRADQLREELKLLGYVVVDKK